VSCGLRKKRGPCGEERDGRKDKRKGFVVRIVRLEDSLVQFPNREERS
jgi:hypothetical protein